MQELLLKFAEECADIMKRFFRERRARKKAAQKNIDKSTCHD